MKKLFFAIPVLVLGGIFYFAGSSQAPATLVDNEPLCATKPPPTKTEQGKPIVKGSTPLEAAAKYFEVNGIRIEEHHEVRPTLGHTPLGSYIDYGFYQDGVPILGMSIRVRLNRNNEVVSVEDEYQPLPKADTTPRLTATEVAEQAGERYEFFSTQTSTETAGKVLYARKRGESPELAWAMAMNCGPTPCQVLLRASDGQLLARHLSRVEFQRAPKF